MHLVRTATSDYLLRRLTRCTLSRWTDKISSRRRSERTVERDGACALWSQQWCDPVYDVRGAEAVENRSTSRGRSWRGRQESGRSSAFLSPTLVAGGCGISGGVLTRFTSTEQSRIYSHVRIFEIGRDRNHVSVPSHSISYTGELSILNLSYAYRLRRNRRQNNLG